jgi:hypothetical protein
MFLRQQEIDTDLFIDSLNRNAIFSPRQTLMDKLHVGMARESLNTSSFPPPPNVEDRPRVSRGVT